MSIQSDAGASAAAEEIKGLVEQYGDIGLSKYDLIEIIKTRCDEIISAADKGYY